MVVKTLQTLFKMRFIPDLENNKNGGFMAKVQRTTKVYELKQGRKKVYIGISNDPERRAKEHARAGKKFTHMNVLTNKKTQSNAKKMERELIEKYGGTKSKTPKYNKTLWG